MTDNAPGWEADPTGRHEHRYWDGAAWTDHVSDAGVASTDAYATAADATNGDATTADTGLGAPVDGAPDATADSAPEAEAPAWADPTTTLPAASADPTATWPTSPAPPPPPAYTPPPPGTGGPLGPDGSGGSKRGLLVGGGILAAVAVAVIVFLLLGGGDDDGDDVRTQLAAQFRASSDLTDDQADCVADHVVDEIGADRFEGVDLSADEPPEELADDLFAAAAGSVEACDIDPADLAGDGGDDEPSGDGTYGSDPELDALYDRCEDGDYQACDDLYSESPSGSEYEEFADTCGGRNEPAGYCVDIYEDGSDEGSATDGDLPVDFEEQLAEIYESSLGLSAEQAECLAGKLAAAVSSGDLTESEAFSEIFEFLSDCDIDPSEISGN